jgi:hypothetical protein
VVDMTDQKTPPPQVWPSLRAKDARGLIRFLTEAFGFVEVASSVTGGGSSTPSWPGHPAAAS